VKFGCRTFLRNPSLTIVSVLSLALATGATAAVFSVLNGVVLRPFPFADPDRIVQVSETSMMRDDLEALRAQSRSLQMLSEYSPATRHLQTTSGTERITAVVSDRDLFAVLGTQPIAGRTFRRDDDQFVAVVSERLSNGRFGGRQNAVGATVTLDDLPFTVIGVMPDAFQFPYSAASVLRGAMAEARVEAWVAEYRPLRSRVGRLVARLKPGVTPDSATAELSAVERRRTALDGQQRLERAHAVSYSEAVLGSTRRSLWLLFGAVALVLAAACANVANLLLALATTRLREVATRAALGASRAHLVRQFVIESALLACAGGSAGLVVAWWTGSLLVSFTSQRIPRAHQVELDWTVFGFLLLISSATALVFSLAPALAARRVDAGMVNRESTRATTSRSLARGRDVFVVSEIALAVVLASSAALVIAEMDRVRRSDNGMVTSGVGTFHLGQPLAPGIESQYYEIADRVASLPTVQAAGFIQVLPLQNWGWGSSSTDFSVRGQPPRTDRPFTIELRFVTPGYFDALGIRIRSGRGFNSSDTRDSPRVILINETLARLYFGESDPVGIEMNRGHIVGVVSDVRQAHLDQPAVPEIYTPMSQNWSQVADLGMTLVVRASGTLQPLEQAVRTQVREVNPRIAIFNIRTMDEVVADSLWNLNLFRWLIGWFAALTLTLAAVGLYGVISYGVTARRREWALRLALGSAPSGVTNRVLRRGIGLTAIGVAAGGVLIVVLTRWIGSMVQIGSDLSGAMFTAVSLLMTAIALAASWLPAVRVSRIAPAAALRHE
jgi:predicted permease